MTFKEKEQLLRYLFLKRKQILMYEPCVCEKEYSEDDAKLLFMRWMQYAFDHCTKDEQLILEKEFILFEDRCWWYEYYSRSTYYRLKLKAMDTFLDCLHQ